MSSSPRGTPRRLAGAGLYLMYLLLAAELLLQVLARAWPALDLLLANRYGAQPYVSDTRLGLRPNPRYGDHDAWGFRNAGSPTRAGLVALGDSQTYGVSARREEAWPQQLAHLLHARVYNMACGGWGPAHYPLLLPQALKLRPRRLLLVLYTGNDLWDALAMVYLRHGIPELEPEARTDADFGRLVASTERTLGAASIEAARLMDADFALSASGAPVPARDAWPGILRDHCKLWGAFRALRTRVAPRQAAAPAVDPARVEAHWAALVERARTSAELAVYERGQARTALDVGYRLGAFDERLWPEGLRLCLRSLELVRAGARGHDVSVLVVLIPTKELVFYPSAPAEVQAKGSYRLLVERERQARAQAMTFLDARGISWVDTAEALERAVAQGQPVYPYTTDSHPNARGYALIADTVAQRLADADYNRTEAQPGS